MRFLVVKARVRTALPRLSFIVARYVLYKKGHVQFENERRSDDKRKENLVGDQPTLRASRRERHE